VIITTCTRGDYEYLERIHRHRPATGALRPQFGWNMHFSCSRTRAINTSCRRYLFEPLPFLSPHSPRGSVARQSCAVGPVVTIDTVSCSSRRHSIPSTTLPRDSRRHVSQVAAYSHTLEAATSTCRRH